MSEQIKTLWLKAPTTKEGTLAETIQKYIDLIAYEDLQIRKASRR